MAVTLGISSSLLPMVEYGELYVRFTVRFNGVVLRYKDKCLFVRYCTYRVIRQEVISESR
jgi:hypothetical protein